ncbi:ATP-binding protein [Agaribacter flavus]|uniref:histidine kinase n=1 Tax=Agaribacter flavus TaxID=1902781 RepID=A0ABV7FN77_9ALTE
MYISLRNKTISGVAFIEAALLVILIFTAVSFLTRIVDEMLINRAKTTAELFATTTKDAVLSYDLASLEVFAEELMNNPDLAYVRVFAQNGQVLTQRGDTDELERKFAPDSSLTQVEDGVFDTQADIKQGDYTYGRVELGISIKNTQQAIAKVRNWSVSIALVELVLVALFSFILGNYLTRQLALLRIGARRVRDAIGTGNFNDVKVEVKGNDELSELAVSFNKLIDSLKHELTLNKKQREVLEELNESLEEKVALRTKALSKKNKDLLKANKEIKETQQQLLQAEKMASVGQLAAGIAHEINNPIGFVNSNLSTLKDYVNTYQLIVHEFEQLSSCTHEQLAEKLPALKALLDKENLEFINEDIGDLLNESNEGLQRVTEIVSGLKLFSRADSDEKQLFDLNECLKTTLNMVRNELKYVCDIETDFGSLPKTTINVGKISQVFTNIFINAAQAIKSTEKFGRVRISTEVDRDDILVKVSDSGPGISESAKAKLFNPFFTTKKEGEGTGLGLSISIGIVTEHGGTIDVQSSEGQGATFIVRLPINTENEQVVL